MAKPKDDGQTYSDLSKSGKAKLLKTWGVTTNGDGMERMATKFFEDRSGWIYFPMTGTREDAIGHLKTLLRKVAREARRNQTAKMLEIASDGLNEVLIHLNGSTCDCGEELGDIDAANSAREALCKLRKLQNRRSA